jgi:hypothetical protein
LGWRLDLTDAQPEVFPSYLLKIGRFLKQILTFRRWSGSVRSAVALTRFSTKYCLRLDKFD